MKKFLKSSKGTVMNGNVFFLHIDLCVLARDLITNIASKYDLQTTQIAVSSVESDGMTSFQIMPLYAENADDFQRKMDLIDSDVSPSLSLVLFIDNGVSCLVDFS